MKDTESAIIWIVDILKRNNIPFQITGGFAAHVYGSKRQVNDIDIDIPDDRISDILPFVKEYITEGPDHHHSQNWDLYMMVLNYKGQDIDICGGSNAEIYDLKSKKWIPCKARFDMSVIKEVYGVDVPVIDKNELIEYKSILQREVDKLDVEALKVT